MFAMSAEEPEDQKDYRSRMSALRRKIGRKDTNLEEAQNVPGGRRISGSASRITLGSCEGGSLTKCTVLNSDREEG